MSYEIEVSKIKPTVEEIKKKIKAQKIKPDNTEFNDRSFKSYIENGFDPYDPNNDAASVGRGTEGYD